MSSLADTKIFNQKNAVVESWYWALKSKELKKGQIKHLTFLGEELAIYRGDDEVVRVVQAYCPHMGAHLAEGKVDGKGIRCFFHAWKFAENGELVDIPCRKSPGIKEQFSFQRHAGEQRIVKRSFQHIDIFCIAAGQKQPVIPHYVSDGGAGFLVGA